VKDLLIVKFWNEIGMHIVRQRVKKIIFIQEHDTLLA